MRKKRVEKKTRRFCLRFFCVQLSRSQERFFTFNLTRGTRTDNRLFISAEKSFTWRKYVGLICVVLWILKFVITYDVIAGSIRRNNSSAQHARRLWNFLHHHPHSIRQLLYVRNLLSVKSHQKSLISRVVISDSRKKTQRSILPHHSSDDDDADESVAHSTISQSAHMWWPLIEWITRGSAPVFTRPHRRAVWSFFLD